MKQFQFSSLLRITVIRKWSCQSETDFSQLSNPDPAIPRSTARRFAAFHCRNKFLSEHFPPMMVFSGRRVVVRASSFSPHKSALRFKAWDEAGLVSRSILRVPDARVTCYVLHQRNTRERRDTIFEYRGKFPLPNVSACNEISEISEIRQCLFRGRFCGLREYRRKRAAHYHTSFRTDEVN